MEKKREGQTQGKGERETETEAKGEKREGLK